MAKSYAQELDDIRRAARGAFGRQRDVFESAVHVLNDAARLAQRYGKREVFPRVRDEYDERLAPLIASGVASGRRLLSKAPLAGKPKSGIGGFIAAGFAVALVAGVAYVAWQVLRTDDEAWVDDDFDVD